VALEKTPLKSKKFIAFFFTSLVIAGILVTALCTQQFVWAMALFMGIGMVVLGFLGIGYVLSQSALDKFVRGIGLLGNAAGKLTGGSDDETDEPTDESVE
jgi:hypothetical protein